MNLSIVLYPTVGQSRCLQIGEIQSFGRQGLRSVWWHLQMEPRRPKPARFSRSRCENRLWRGLGHNTRYGEQDVDLCVEKPHSDRVQG